ncbi:MAG: BNR-4 repeat-containing protein [Verrucomicrobia bacterium]|nr:BNR-4 repeat-containing protein [Verrucomicrobiota bacterium]
MSNKIITRNDRIFVVWLDHVSDVRAKMYDTKTRTWGESVTVGKGVDNHSGPALTMDDAGHLHVVYGTHHHPFKYRRTVRPLDITEWTGEELFGKKGTYPSVITAPNDVLWCACRSSLTNPWRLRLFRRMPDCEWDHGLDILDVGVTGYAWLGNSLAVDSKGTVHLAFVIYDEHPKGGKACGYLCTRDDGKTWQTADGRTMDLPVGPKSECFVEQGRTLDMRVKSVVLDPEGLPWFSAIHLERSPRSVLLWHYNGKAWDSVNLLPSVEAAMPGHEVVDAGISFDREGTLYAACTVEPVVPRDRKWFGHASQEVVLLVSSDRGKHFDVIPISEEDASKPNWLASIERPFSGEPLDHVPAILYTHGGPGEGCTGGPATEVVFVRLGK